MGRPSKKYKSTQVRVAEDFATEASQLAAFLGVDFPEMTMQELLPFVRQRLREVVEAKYNEIKEPQAKKRKRKGEK